MNQLSTINSTVSITNESELATAIDAARAMQAVLDDFWANIKAQMKETGTTELKGTWGSYSPTERKLWTVSDITPDKYVRRVAEEALLNAEYLLGNTIPGTDFKVIKYLVPHYISKKRVEA